MSNEEDPYRRELREAAAAFKKDWMPWTLGSAAVLAMALGLTRAYAMHGDGARGDWIGGNAAPLIALAGNLLIIATLIVQGRQLKAQQEELEETRKDVKNANCHRETAHEVTSITWLSDRLVAVNRQTRDVRERVSARRQEHERSTRATPLQGQTYHDPEEHILSWLNSREHTIKKAIDQKVKRLALLDEDLARALEHDAPQTD